MFKLSEACKLELSIIRWHHLTQCLKTNLPCANKRLLCSDAARRFNVFQNRNQINSFPLFGRFVRTSHVSVRTQSNSNDKEGDSVNEEVCADKPIPQKKLDSLIDKFMARPMLHQLEEEYGIDAQMSRSAGIEFKKWCRQSEELPQDLHIVMSDILQKSGTSHVDDLFPFYLKHTRKIFPELECMEDLKKISDLTQPTTWYPESRTKQRKVIYHAGPTNSGKTYHALQRFLAAKSGVYCGPLRLLAAENFKKANANGTPCDLITGEERKYVNESGEPSGHQACTVEMTNLAQPYDVAVIDEIQMVRDTQRGWAFTRAFLGVCADEIHVCGEEAGVNLIRDLTVATGDTFEVKRYNRLTKLKILDRGIDTFNNIKPGDCIVCFNKNDIFNVTKQLEKRGVEVAVIYGTLPPGTKLSQAEKFNDPEDTCKVMVATDAVGMGLNLSIKRVVFYSLMKPVINADGEKELDLIPPPSALQIAGRAGRYLTQFSKGEVTTFHSKHLPTLKKLLASKIDPIKQAGLAPTAEQLESFAFHLPKKSLSDLIDIFVRLCNVDDSKYFMCNMNDFKFLAGMIQHLPLDIKVRYTFCCSPINKKQQFACAMFVKFASQFSKGKPLTADWVLSHFGYPFELPTTLKDLIHLENVFDVIDLYLWLSYRFPSIFPDVERMREVQKHLDGVIQLGVRNIVRLLIQENNLDAERAPNHHLDNFTEDTSLVKEKPKKSTFSMDELDRVVIKNGQKISTELLKRGIVTKDMLDKLKDEIFKEKAKLQSQKNKEDFQQKKTSQNDLKTNGNKKM